AEVLVIQEVAKDARLVVVLRVIGWKPGEEGTSSGDGRPHQAPNIIQLPLEHLGAENGVAAAVGERVHADRIEAKGRLSECRRGAGCRVDHRRATPACDGLPVLGPERVAPARAVVPLGEDRAGQETPLIRGINLERILAVAGALEGRDLGTPNRAVGVEAHRQWIIRPFRPQLVIEAVGKIPLLDEGQHQTEPRRILAVRKDVVTAYVGGTWDEGIPDLADVPGREAVA